MHGAEPQKEREVWEKMKEVMDPEFGFPIVSEERRLVDEVRVEGGRAVIKYHLTVPFCPPIFALRIGREIRQKALEVPGVEKVEVVLQGHAASDAINKMLREEG